jgi:hypothetical protein
MIPPGPAAHKLNGPTFAYEMLTKAELISAPEDGVALDQVYVVGVSLAFGISW